jgi:hypothetical protein
VRISTAEAVTAVATGVTAFAAVKMGYESAIPTFGPVTPPIAALILGGLILALIDGEGDTGKIARGVGYGLVAAGAVTFGG